MRYSLSIRKPCPQLTEVVWSYGYKNVQFLNRPFTHRVTAKAAPVLEFMFGERPLLRHELMGTTTRSPVSLLIGPHTKPGTQLELSGGFESFAIVFRPVGLHKLLGFPIHEISNEGADAASVIGRVVKRMGEMLGNCSTFEERVELANQLLLDFYNNSIRRKGISAVVNRILQSGGDARIDALFRETGLSKRTFERRFQEQVGMSAKLFSRITRFQTALDMKARLPRSSWTAIAQDCGYFDQMHLIHDFEEFTARCPGEVLRSVERIYGNHIHATPTRDNSELPDSLLL